MADVFISYARSTEKQAQRVAELLRAQGYSVWRDEDLPSHRAYSDVIEEQLASAKAVVVIWSSEAATSQWVRSEAGKARADNKLVQVRIDKARLPMPFDQIQCADLVSWTGDTDAPGWRKVVASVTDLTRGGAAPESRPIDQTVAVAPHTDSPLAAAATGTTRPASGSPLIAVLPFDNLSGERDMEYFSDGMSEEILQTVAQTTKLKVIGRSSSFQFRGAEKSAHKVASALHCTHLLDGSVRRAGIRIRIAASLIECGSQTQLWADRFERDLSDVFALQDEIAAAVAKALNARFAPSPAAGPIDPEAYDLFLKARTISPGWVNGRFAAWLGSYDRASLERATTLSPNFAKAWAALAMTRGIERGSDEPFESWRDDVTAAANRALTLDPNTGIAYAALALLEPPCGHFGEVDALLNKALEVSPNDPDVLIQASLHAYKKGGIRQAQSYAARAYEIDPLYDQAECWHGMMLLQSGQAEEAYRIFDVARARKPQFDHLTDFPMNYAACHGQWSLVDRLRVAVPAEIRRGEHAAMTKQGVDALEVLFRPNKNPLARLRQTAMRPLVRSSIRSLVETSRKTGGMIPFTLIGFCGQTGLVDEIYSAIERSDFTPLSAPGGRHLANDAGLQLLFEWHSAPLRRDSRFAKLCARLGLAQYYLKSGFWPDCVSEVASAYDFKTACASAAA